MVVVAHNYGNINNHRQIPVSLPLTTCLWHNRWCIRSHAVPALVYLPRNNSSTRESLVCSQGSQWSELLLQLRHESQYLRPSCRYASGTDCYRRVDDRYDCSVVLSGKHSYQDHYRSL